LLCRAASHLTDCHSAIISDFATLILTRDPTLQTERGQALRHLLYLFGKDEAIKLIRAG
jgi:ATP-dependent DNA helicase RecG